MNRILYFTYESISLQPIITSQVLPLLKGMADKQDFKFDLITVEPKGKRFTDISVNIIHFTQENYLVSFLKRLFYLYENINKYEIVHIRGYFPMIFMLFLRNRYKGKIIFDMRGILPEEFKFRANTMKYKLYSKIFSFLEKYFVKKSDLIVVVSNNFKNYIKEKYDFIKDSQIQNIPTFSCKSDLVNNSFKDQYKFNTKDKVFVYSGSMEKWQKFDKIVCLFKRINIHIPESKLMVFTHQREIADEILSEKLNAENYRVDFVDNKHLNAYLRSCDFGLLLREKHIVNKVSAPIKFNDYLVAELPVIISSGIGDSKEVLEKYPIGLIIDSIEDEKHIDDFVDKNIGKIRELLSNNLDDKFGEIYNKKLGINNAIEKYIKAYNELIKE